MNIWKDQIFLVATYEKAESVKIIQVDSEVAAILTIHIIKRCPYSN